MEISFFHAYTFDQAVLTRPIGLPCFFIGAWISFIFHHQMGRAAARRGKNCVLTDIYGKAIDALIVSIVKKKGIPTFSGFSGHSMSLGFFKWLHAALISFFTHLSLVFQTVNFLIQQCPFLSKHETRWSVIILWKSFLFLSTPTRLITCHHIWFWQAFNWSSEHLTMCEFLPRVLSSPSRFKLHFALPVGSLDNVITFHLTFLNLWGKCLLILE